MADLTAFATAAELAAFWKTLSTDEIARANSLLLLASNRLRGIGEKTGVDVDARVAASAVYTSNVKWVVMEATKRAMLTPTDQPPVNQYQQTAGVYSENYTYTNPSGDLWFKSSELSEIGLTGNQKLRSISTSSTDIYSPYEYGS